MTVASSPNFDKGAESTVNLSANSISNVDNMIPTFQSAYSSLQTPLILSRDWLDTSSKLSSAGPVGDCTYRDFQSNHPENVWLNPGSISLHAGLGIKNVDLNKDIETPGLVNLALDGLHDQEHQPNISKCCRTETIYDMFEQDGLHEVDSLLERYSDITTTLAPSWSFSSIFKAAELTKGNSASELQKDSSMDLGSEVPSIINDDSGSESSWSFEKLSAATGLSVVELAAQISATAEVALKQISENNIGQETYVPQSNNLHYFDDFTSLDLLQSWPSLEDRTSETLDDINMRDLISPWNSDMGVNPADIMHSSISSTPVLDKNPSEACFSTYDTGVSHEVAMDDRPIEYEYSSQYVLALDPALTPYPSYTFPELISPVITPEDEPKSLHSPSTGSEYSLPIVQALNSKRNYSSRVSTRRKTRKIIMDESEYNDYQVDHDSGELPPVDLGTPVFDAHRGMDLEVLKAKAERYRLRNQGRDYDKRWLISFAGKLSPKGELIEEFRCYVTGCKQSNKRRDHILIHVGAHLDQRPFKCMHCSARFLRKNECKRHELSHTGIRPFSCHLCPSPTISFVRQDLLKRHMKRTHRQDLKSDKENTRPKKRAKC